MPVVLQVDVSALSALNNKTNNKELLPSLLFEKYKSAAEGAIAQLVSSRHTPGAWTDWLNVTEQPQTIADIKAYAQQARGKYTDMLVLGIGGSSLGGYALLKGLCHPYWNALPEAKRDGWLRYHFVDNVDADTIVALDDVLDWSKTLVVVITKSGTTAETMSAMIYIKAKLESQLGDSWKQQMLAITDPEKGLLRQLVNEWQISSLPVGADVGGRFSVFSAVGLLPAALCGIDVDRILAGVKAIMPVVMAPDLATNLAAQTAVLQVAYDKAGFKQSVFMPYSARLAAVADWYVQLWAESLGKKRVAADGQTVYEGQTPIKAVGVTDQHAQVQLFNEGPIDKLVTFVEVAKADTTLTIPANTLSGLEYLGNKTFNQLMQAEFEATRRALSDNGRPSWTLRLESITPESMGQLLFYLQVQTGLAGHLMGIDPFDQPGVELGKLYTYALMGRKGFEHYLPAQPVGV
jgi:glucose-6-phosphate isomerase